MRPGEVKSCSGHTGAEGPAFEPRSLRMRTLNTTPTVKKNQKNEQTHAKSYFIAQNVTIEKIETLK